MMELYEVNELTSYLDSLQIPESPFNTESIYSKKRIQASSSNIEALARTGVTSRIVYEDVVTIESTVSDGVMVKCDWPTLNSRLMICSKDIENPDYLAEKNVTCILKIFKKGFLRWETINYVLVPVKPLILDASKINQVINKIENEDPWTF